MSKTSPSSPSLASLSPKVLAAAADCVLLNERELAALLRCSVSTIQTGRLTDGGPPTVRIGRLAKRYRPCDVSNWLQRLAANGGIELEGG